VTFVKGSGSKLYIQPRRRVDPATLTVQDRRIARRMSPAGPAAVCNVVLYGVGEQSKRAYVSFDGAHTWTRQGTPSVFGYIDDLAAGSSRDWVLDDERTGFDTTTDDGSHWRFGVLHVDLDDGVAGAQFTTPSTVVALPAYMPNRDFLRSDDGGLTWSVTRFPKWPRARSFVSGRSCASRATSRTPAGRLGAAIRR
jgi:hypothetical protein